MPPPHNWRLRLQLMHTPFFSRASLVKTNPPFPQPHYCIVTAPESPWQQTCATACSPVSPPLHLLSSSLTKKLRELESTNVQHLPQWSTEVDAVEGRKDIFHNNLSTEKSPLVQLVAIGNSMRTRSKEETSTADGLEVGGIYSQWQGETASCS